MIKLKKYTLKFNYKVNGFLFIFFRIDIVKRQRRGTGKREFSQCTLVLYTL